MKKKSKNFFPQPSSTALSSCIKFIKFSMPLVKKTVLLSLLISLSRLKQRCAVSRLQREEQIQETVIFFLKLFFTQVGNIKLQKCIIIIQDILKLFKIKVKLKYKQGRYRGNWGVVQNPQIERFVGITFNFCHNLFLHFPCYRLHAQKQKKSQKSKFCQTNALFNIQLNINLLTTLILFSYTE